MEKKAVTMEYMDFEFLTDTLDSLTYIFEYICKEHRGRTDQKLLELYKQYVIDAHDICLGVKVDYLEGLVK